LKNSILIRFFFHILGHRRGLCLVRNVRQELASAPHVPAIGVLLHHGTADPRRVELRRAVLAEPSVVVEIELPSTTPRARNHSERRAHAGEVCDLTARIHNRRRTLARASCRSPRGWARVRYPLSGSNQGHGRGRSCGGP